MMASSTSKLRKSSRVSSPAPKAGKEAPTLEMALADPKKKTFMDRWAEPTLPSPVPSYQDYGLERGGVLEQMRPLGQMPPQKGQGQVKRLIHLKNGSLSSSSKEVSTVPSESTGNVGSRRTESSRPEGTKSHTPPPKSKTASPKVASPRVSSPRVSSPKVAARPPSKIFALKPTNTRLSIPPGVAASPDQQRLARIMEEAIDRSYSIGDETMALSLKKLFRDSFSDARLHQTLQATLYPGTRTDADHKAFQLYVKEARHLFKKPKSHSSSSQKASSQTPVQHPVTSHVDSPSKSQRSGAASGTRRMANKDEAAAAFQPPVSANMSNSSTPTTRSTRRSGVNGAGKHHGRHSHGHSQHDESGQNGLHGKSKSTGKGKGKGNITTSEKERKGENESTLRTSRSKSNSSAVSSLTSIGSSEMEAPRGMTGQSSGAEGDLAEEVSNPPNKSARARADNPAHASTSFSTDRAHRHHSHQHDKSPTSPGPKLHTFMTTANSASGSTSTSTTTNGHVSKSKAKSVNALKRDSAAAELDDEKADAELEAKRKKFERKFHDAPVQESAMRGSLGEGRTAAAKRASGAKQSSSHLKNLNSRGLQLDAVNGKRKSRDEDDALPSASSSAFEDHLLQGRVTGSGPSRPETPTNVGRPAKKAKKTPRVKTSPMKKKNGVIAGISRTERESSPGHGNMTEPKDDDNNDYCSACSGSGELLCCDGCDRSFHFLCLDPPMDAESLPDAWFCYVCAAKRDPIPKPPRSLFASLGVELAKENPKAYELPHAVREYFQGVKTGDEGEYEEAVTQKARPRTGYEEAPDLLKLKDPKGKHILCYKCGKSSLNQQEIIPCDYCNLHWHLDCLDPPLANPPPRLPNGKPRHNWMCPNHVDQELKAISTSSRRSSIAGAPGNGTRTYKVRRPRRAKVVDTALSRGFVNNGLIEIENDPSDDEGVDRFYEQQDFGHIYRLPEKGIKLDFIDKVRRQREARDQARVYGAEYTAIRNAQQSAAQAQIKANFEKHSFSERQVALGLFQMSQPASQNVADLDADMIENLITTLISEAPADVASLIDKQSSKDPNIPLSPPSSDSRLERSSAPPSKDEKNMLLLVQELIKRRLEGVSEKEPESGEAAETERIQQVITKTEPIDKSFSEIAMDIESDSRQEDIAEIIPESS